MAFALVVNGVVTQKSCSQEAGFIPCPDHVCFGYLYANGVWSAPSPTLSNIQLMLEKSVQQHLDAQAQLVGYDNILSACSYAATANAFQTESKSFLNWRAACWVYCYNLLAQVQAGTAQTPTQAALIAGLPARV